MRKGKGRNNGLLPNSLRIISSCLKTVSTNASNVASTVRSAGASVAASISTSSEDHKDQVTWAGFDRLELGPSHFKRVLLLGYQNGFQVFDVEEASNYSELVSKRDGPVSFLQMQPCPLSSDGQEGFRASHPILLVVASYDTNGSSLGQNAGNLVGVARDCRMESLLGNSVNSPTAVRCYSLRSHCYVHVLRFRSFVCMIRCSSRIVAVGLATQIYCFDALTLENKFSVLTYPVPQLVGQGAVGVNVGFGPMAVGPRWLAYASSNPLVSNTGRLSSQNITPSPGVSPSTSPGGSSLVARYAMESSKHLATGLISLGDMGYRTLSKCCQELLPDGSNSPVSQNSVWKVGRLAGTDMDNAGMVVVKDFVSQDVISQFKAHTSPISALSFDPTGTLLVTASVYGNNINIFRIMPSHVRSGTGVQSHHCSSSHVHLYKLHRGITSAMIQDICFSHYSQWVAIVSSKGTCHIFVLSPFGGDTGFQTLSSQGEEPSLSPVLSLPWWSTSSCVTNQQSFPPPLPVALSVVTRIKYSSFGWLSTVSNAANSATGKVFVPSGAVSAVFHNSISPALQHVDQRTTSLEHLLVYTPSGHVVQHELLPSIGADSGASNLKFQTTAYTHVQEDDLTVKVEPVQWWDVCRRSDWPEREECISKATFERQDVAEDVESKPVSEEFGIDSLEINDNVSGEMNTKPFLTKPHDSFHWYISNAEVQVNSWRLPIWQKTKISFYMMDSPRPNSCESGEFEIEQVPVHEVEIKSKELLPVFDSFQRIKSSWNDRCFAVGKYTPSLSPDHHQGEYKASQEIIICHSKPASLSSTESSGGSSRRLDNLLDFDQINCDKPYPPIYQGLNEICHLKVANGFIESSVLNQESLAAESSPFQHLENIYSDTGHSMTSDFYSLESKLPPLRTKTDGTPSCNAADIGSASMLHVDHYDAPTDIVVDESSICAQLIPVDFGHFQEGHYDILQHSESGKLSEHANDDVDSSSNHRGKEKLEDDGENDEMVGGMFVFS
ncbi:Autophagy-related protein 18g [Hibiscus syriacus]|uniref:Autophagy-related protein 18g n=1 Tax=Hibiscus syriacus TaxID=106335 RepID=A0A6A2Z0U3_HIBSY|nr:autophagy-related protein 18g-like [Hibiscus syriacus]KAE8685501.1 Autophagy-related protein 18g [Hibiscus syriacus]